MASQTTESNDGAPHQLGGLIHPHPLPRGERVFGRFAVWTTVVPFVVLLCGIMLAGYLEKFRAGERKKWEAERDEILKRYGNIPDEHAEYREEPLRPEEYHRWFSWRLSWYPSAYTITIAVTLALMVVASPGYFKIPFRVHGLSVAVGLIGIVVWLGLVYVDKTTLDLGSMLSKVFGERSAFNPFEELKPHPTWMWQFFAIRFVGLIFVVPVVEEFFLRGFLMRYVDDPDWDEIPLGIAKFGGAIAPAVYGVIAHPGEPIAALIWFSMVTWLYLRTRSIWDCVAAHAITNLLLGLYIVQFGRWELW